jgi:AAA+ superfamily predicted ATPase
MAGLICGFYGYQRSGKTLLAYLIAKKYHSLGIPVYTNMETDEFKKIESLTEIPLNTDHKVLLLDEVYSFMDSRNWQDVKGNTSLFFNTIGKQNILLLMTAIIPSMIESRLRQQHNYMIIAKGSEKNIQYKIVDVQRNISSMFVLEKTKQLFKNLNYNTLQVPDLVDCNLKDFAEKVRRYKEKIKM